MTVNVTEDMKKDLEALWKGSEPYFFKMCGFSRDPEGYREQINQAIGLRDRWKESILPRAVLTSYPVSVLYKQGFSFSDSFERMLEETKIDQVVFYGLCLYDTTPEEAEEDFLEQFYLDGWKLSLLYSSQDWLRHKIREEWKEKQRIQDENQEEEQRIQNNEWEEQQSSRNEDQPGFVISDAIGPGYYGLGVQTVAEFYELLPCKSIGMELVNQTLWPTKSAVGFYLISQEELGIPKIDCKNCLSGRNTCEFCKNSLMASLESDRKI